MKRLLIVDDELDILELYRDFFKMEGITDITYASDGIEAFVLCTQHEYDIITLDHEMPFMKGADFLKAIRNKENKNMKTIVMMISAFIPDIENSMKNYENTFFFDKPVDLVKLARYIKIMPDKKTYK